MGLKILLAMVHVGDLASLAIIVGLLAAGIVVSLVADRVDPPAPAEEAARRPPRSNGSRLRSPRARGGPERGGLRALASGRGARRPRAP